MQDEMNPGPKNLTTPYSAVAIYYEGADMVEYVRRDAPSVCVRVDELLTLVVDMRNRDDLIGFRLKGFRNYYLRNLSGLDDFVSLVGVLEREITEVGNTTFDRRDAYQRARTIAISDSVVLKDLPVSEAMA